VTENSLEEAVCANLDSVLRWPVDDFCKLLRSGAVRGTVERELDGAGARADGAPRLTESLRLRIIEFGLTEVVRVDCINE
jgi:hypothetical protein